MNSPQEGIIASPFKPFLDIIQTLTPPTAEEIEARKVCLGPRTKKNTLVLDLDQTLVHAGAFSATGNETDQGKEYALNIRPFAYDLIKSMGDKFEMVMFTSAGDHYAKQVYDHFNSTGPHFSRLLTKEFCVVTKEGYIVKDLRIFADRPLDRILIVDDCIISFAFQLANGIPVTPYDGSPDDEELMHLRNYLLKVYNDDNIVATNKQLLGIISN